MYNAKTIHLNTNTQSNSWALGFIFIATIIQAVFGFARDATPLWKAFIALCCWCSIFFSIKKISFTKTYPKFARYICYIMIFCVIQSLLKALFTGEAFAGEKYTVLFTNMYSTLDLVGIFFITTITDFKNLKSLLKATYWLIPISILILTLNYSRAIESYFLAYIMLFSSIFFPYVKKRSKILLLTGYSISLFAFFGGGRQIILIMFFCLLSILIGFWGNRKITFWISLLIFLSPLILIIYSINYGSIFAVLQQGQEYQPGMNVDTRTFLWVELFSDMSSQNFLTQLFGKGSLAYYVSDWFGSSHRLGIEVPILQWFLQAGFLYIFCLTLLVLFSIVQLYKHGNNRMCQIASIMIAGTYFNMFVSNLIGCNISTLGFWFITSIAFNQKFLKATDLEIKTFLQAKPKKVLSSRNSSTF